MDEYILVQDGGLVANACCMKEMVSIHNFEIQPDKYGVFLIAAMLTDLNIVPTLGNNFDECLNCDQFGAWNKENAIQVVDIPEYGYNAIRDTATVSYFREAKRRRIHHELEPSLTKKKYNIGDTIGIYIHKVDITNTDSKLLPCKILEVIQIQSIRFSLRIVFIGYLDIFPLFSPRDIFIINELTMISANVMYNNYSATGKNNNVSFKCLVYRTRCDSSDNVCLDFITDVILYVALCIFDK